jgi:hypothetical protein
VVFFTKLVTNESPGNPRKCEGGGKRIILQKERRWLVRNWLRRREGKKIASLRKILYKKKRWYLRSVFLFVVMHGYVFDVLYYICLKYFLLLLRRIGGLRLALFAIFPILLVFWLFRKCVCLREVCLSPCFFFSYLFVSFNSGAGTYLRGENKDVSVL